MSMRFSARLAPVAVSVGLAFVIPSGSFGQQTPAQRQAAPYVVGRALPPVDSGRPLVALTVDQAITRALDSNLDLQSIRMQTEIQEYSLRSAYAAFAPTLNTTLSHANQTNQSTSQLDGGARTTTERLNLNTSLAKTMPWYGGRVSLGFNNTRTETNNAFTTRNPSYNTSLSFNYVQPLLSGFDIDAQRAGVRTQNIQTRIVDLQVRGQIENLKFQVRQAYWGLRSAIEQIEIQRINLTEAQQLLEENRIRVRVGRAVELQLAQSEAQVASARQSLLNAEIQWRNQEFALKRLLLSGASDPLLMQTVNPVDQPVLVETPVDIQAAVQRALTERMDIAQQRQQRDISEVNLDVSKTDARPDLTLTAAYSLAGVGGNLYNRSSLGGAPVLVEPGGYIDGLSAIRGFDTPTWSLTLNGSYPIGPNTNKAALERAKLQLKQTDLALKGQELAILTEVTTAGLAVRNTFLQVEAARLNTQAAERSLQAELLRFNLGVATSFELVTSQSALTAARLSELQAIINHVNAVAEFDRVQRIGN
jgi:outer membrane protein